MARRLTQSELVEVYGRPGDERRITRIRTPWTDPLDGKHLYIAVNTRIAEWMCHAMGHAVRPAWTPKRVDSLAVRKIRGGESWSLHAFGLAFDFFATPRGVPPPGGVWTPDDPVTPDFAAAFTSHGFTWGGEWKRTDLPHIEWAGNPP